MTFRVTSFFSIAILCGIAECSGDPHSASAVRSSPSISVCELFRNLTSHKNEIVTIRGILFEQPSYTVGDTDCPHKFVTKGFTWPTTITLQQSAGDFEDGPVPFVTDPDSMRNLDEVILKAPKGSEIWVTITGQLKLKKKYYLAHTNYGVLGVGFGHLGGSPALLLIKRVDKVAVKSASK